MVRVTKLLYCYFDNENIIKMNTCAFYKSIVIFIVLLFIWKVNVSFCQNEGGESKIPNSVISDYLNELKQDSIAQSISYLQSFKTRFSLTQNRKQIAEWIAQKFNSYGYDAKLDSFKVIADAPYYEIWLYNVVADYLGVIWPDDILILGAHYDSKTQSNDTASAPGADNNASGVAAMLEIARVFKLKMLNPNRTIRFIAFTMSENPIIHPNTICGSCEYAHMADSLNYNIKFMFECAEIAYNPPDTSYSYYLWQYSYWLKNFVKFVAHQFVPDLNISSNYRNREKDSWYFYKHGFPSITLNEGIPSPYYNTFGDTISNCNMEYCLEMTKLTCAVFLYAQDTVLGVDDYWVSNELDVYPNPTSGRITVKCGNQCKSLTLGIYDCFGRKCKEIILEPATSTTFDISNLAEGIYYCKTEGAAINYRSKLVLCK